MAPSDHARFYSSFCITLNLMRGEMVAYGWCLSGRFFEVAACDTPLLTDGWQGLDTFFVPWRELLTAGCAEDVEEALEMPDSALQSMAARARERTLDQHTGHVRAVQLLKYLEEAISHNRASLKTEVA